MALALNVQGDIGPVITSTVLIIAISTTLVLGFSTAPMLKKLDLYELPESEQNVVNFANSKNSIFPRNFAEIRATIGDGTNATRYVDGRSSSGYYVS